MKTQATAKFVGTSARKTGLVAALIRGKRAVEAQTILANTNKRAVVPVGKVLASAIANAENNHNAKAADLVVESVLIGPGPTLKRSRPRAKGSASAIRKRSSHITVVVSDGKVIATLGSKKTDTGSAKVIAASQSGAGSDTAKKEEKGSVRRQEAVVAEAETKKPSEKEAK
jgi:large subunit ribosomal protein L22